MTKGLISCLFVLVGFTIPANMHQIVSLLCKILPLQKHDCEKIKCKFSFFIQVQTVIKQQKKM